MINVARIIRRVLPSVSKMCRMIADAPTEPSAKFKTKGSEILFRTIEDEIQFEKPKVTEFKEGDVCRYSVDVLGLHKASWIQIA